MKLGSLVVAGNLALNVMQKQLFVTQNPPFLFFFIVNISAMVQPVNLKICTGMFFEVRNTKMKLKTSLS